MHTVRQLFQNIFVYAGLTREEYREILPAIRRQDRDMLVWASPIAAILLLGLFVVSLRSATIGKSRMLYVSAMACAAVLAVLSHRVLPRHPKLVIFNCYMFLTVIFIFAIVLATAMQPQVPATTFCVMLVAGPLLFIEQPWRMSLFLVVQSVAFCCTSYLVKVPAVAALDIVNCGSFLLVGIAVNASVSRTKMRDLLQRRHIEKARDTDDLTHLLTKAATQREITDYINSEQAPAALLMIDIDNFKQINDVYGHAFGDAVLRLMGECIRQVFRCTDVLGRFGGDEFVLFLPRLHDRAIVTQRVEQLVSVMADKLVIPENARRINGSIGIAVYPEHGTDYATLFRRADEALYESKRQGKNRYSFYVDAMADQQSQA